MIKKNMSDDVQNDVSGGMMKKILILALILVAAGGVGSSYYFYSKYRALKVDANVEAQKQADKFIAALGNLMELPKGEVPTIATISDRNQLTGQAFFAQAQNDDILFAYTTSMKAILYRPSVNKIINVAPIVVNQTQAVASTSAGLKVAYYNGTDTAGLSIQTEKLVKAAYPLYQTLLLTSASSKTYTQNLVVDISGTHAKEAADLAKLLKGKVAPLPAGESRPDADLLVISGT